MGRTGGFSLNFSLLKKTAVVDPMIEISSVTAFCLSILRGKICVVEAKYSKKCQRRDSKQMRTITKINLNIKIASKLHNSGKIVELVENFDR